LSRSCDDIVTNLFSKNGWSMDTIRSCKATWPWSVNSNAIGMMTCECDMKTSFMQATGPAQERARKTRRGATAKWLEWARCCTWSWDDGKCCVHSKSEQTPECTCRARAFFIDSYKKVLFADKSNRVLLESNIQLVLSQQHSYILSSNRSSLGFDWHKDNFGYDFVDEWSNARLSRIQQINRLFWTQQQPRVFFWKSNNVLVKHRIDANALLLKRNNDIFVRERSLQVFWNRNLVKMRIRKWHEAHLEWNYYQ
jgi:hypothetical protein